MNKCPKCGTKYLDPMIFFCLEDGGKLVDSQTENFDSTFYVIDKQPVETAPEEVQRPKYFIALALTGILVLLMIAGSLGYFYSRARSLSTHSSNQNSGNAVR